ncbi:MAG: hypothetical protein M3N47_07955 [Chloroflexota bacterium]|nr:hypothetical protein [Chloroflexota bacterium]
MLGLVVLRWGSLAIDALARVQRAQARWLAGGKEDSMIFRWSAPLTSDSSVDRFLRAALAWLTGLALVGAGLVEVLSG